MIVDIHNHILPGLDDGPHDWEEAILLAKQAVETGITHVIATPHHKHQHHQYFYENDPATIIKMVDKLNQLLQEKNIPLVVMPGIEFHLHEEIQYDLEEKLDSFLTLNNTGKYLLMEPHSKNYPSYIVDVFSQLKEMGFLPILAHPERNRILRKNPSEIYKLVQSGILIQVTAASILGLHGNRLKNFSRHLLDHELVHFVASDAHHYTRRKFELTEAYDFIELHYSSRYREFLQSNAINVVEGKEIKIMTPKYIEKRRQYFFLYNHPLNRVRERDIN